jgi:hypothetical protein
MSVPAQKTVSALAIIDRAYVLLGHKAAGEPLSGDDVQTGLDALNSMIDGWNVQSLFIASVSEVVATVSGAVATIGPGLTFDAPRPVRIEGGGFTRIGSIDYPLTLMGREQYAALALKTVSSTFPEYVYYDADLPDASVHFYPVPSGAVEVHLPMHQYMAEFPDVATEVYLPPGYRRALEYSLAEELAPGLRDLSPLVMKQGALARRVIRRANVDVPLLDCGLRGARFNIYSGQ